MQPFHQLKIHSPKLIHGVWGDLSLLREIPNVYERTENVEDLNKDGWDQIVASLVECNCCYDTGGELAEKEICFL